MGVDAWGFDQERQAIARRLRSQRMRLQVVHAGVFSLLAAALVLGGSGAVRDAVGGRGWPGWASTSAFLGLLFAGFALTELPFAYVGGYRWDRLSGLGTQTLPSWLKDLAKSLAIGVAATLVVGGALVWLIATTPWWWLAAWALGLGVSAILGFLTPVLLVPIFYRLRPLDDSGLRARFKALAARARVPVIEVFELQASTKTRRSNAAVMGFGRTRRIVMTDTLLRDFPPEEIETVLAHELAHQRLLDPLRGFLVGSVVSLVTLWATAGLYALILPAFGLRGVADLAGLPLLAILFGLLALPFRPIELGASRARESRADRFALDLTRNPTAFAAAIVRLHDRNLGVAHPGRWETWFWYSHPTGRERIEAARAFAASRT